METFLIYTAAVAFAVFLLYFAGIALAPYAPSTVKNEHFECGLPASSSVPKKRTLVFLSMPLCSLWQI